MIPTKQWFRRAFVLVLFSALTTLTHQALAQCVQCHSDGGCFDCTASTNGGKGCKPAGCNFCSVYDACGKGFEEVDPIMMESRNSAKPLSTFRKTALQPKTSIACAQNAGTALTSAVQFDPNVIREIGAISPRFGIVLAGLNRGEGLKGRWARVYLTPINVTSDDVEWWLKPETESAAYFKEFDAKGRKINLSGAQPIVYELRLNPQASLPLSTLKVRVIRGYSDDFVHPSFEMDLEETGAPDSGKGTWKIKAWRVN